MKRCCITGHTTGLGLALYTHLVAEGWAVDGFSRSNDHDITKNFDAIVEQIAGCDLFINNAFAKGYQLPLLLALQSRVKKMVVCGSIVSDIPDPIMIEYSKQKVLLEQSFLKIASEKDIGVADLLLLKLTSSSYNNPSIVIDTIEFWIKHADMIVATFNVTDDGPNRY